MALSPKVNLLKVKECFVWTGLRIRKFICKEEKSYRKVLKIMNFIKETKTKKIHKRQSINYIKPEHLRTFQAETFSQTSRWEEKRDQTEKSNIKLISLFKPSLDNCWSVFI